jgi:hypothetical protein
MKARDCERQLLSRVVQIVVEICKRFMRLLLGLALHADITAIPTAANEPYRSCFSVVNTDSLLRFEFIVAPGMSGGSVRPHRPAICAAKSDNSAIKPRNITLNCSRACRSIPGVRARQSGPSRRRVPG